MITRKVVAWMRPLYPWLDRFFGTRRLGLLAVFSVLAFGAETIVLPMPAAHADDASYIRYLNDHGITIGMTNTPSSQLSAGRMVCDNLRAGADPHAGMNFLTRGLVPDGAVDAAQHELCPDTLHGKA
jgi:hypothetical protein